MGSEDRVELIQTVRGSSSASMMRRSRSGVLLLSAFCCIVLTVLFYLCSLDYQTLAVERKLLRYQESLIKNQIQQELELQLLHQQREQNDSQEVHVLDDDRADDQTNGSDDRTDDRAEEPSNRTKDLTSSESEYENRVRQMFEHENAVSSFNIRKKDVIVFLQIQNTGSSLTEQKLVKDLVLEKPCSCVKNRCPCLRPAVTEESDEEADEGHDSYWLFSRKTVGWACGFHSDWSELTYCVDPALDQIEGRPSKRRYFFMTQLRDPVKRFLSEFYRWTRAPVTTGAGTAHSCRGKAVQVDDKCNMTTSMTMQEWISCPYNLALNRQTRMLADLSLVDCYNYSSMSRADRNLILLNSAKANLHKMAFFAMAEYPKVSMKLFEYTFGLRFVPSLMDQIQDLKWSGKRIRGHAGRDLPLELVDLIREANKLDIELYDYAKSLLFDRFNQMEAKRSGQSPTAGKFLQSLQDHKDVVRSMKRLKSGKLQDDDSDEEDGEDEDETM